MTQVPISSPWGTSTFGSEVYPYREDRFYSNDSLYKVYTQTQYSSEEYRTRSLTTEGLFIGPWRLPNSANARIVHRQVWRGHTIEYPSFGNLYRVYRRMPTLPTTGPIRIANCLGDLQVLADRADTEALARLNQQKMELGVSLLEARKSINTLAKAAIRLLTVYRNLRKGKFGAVADELGLNLSRRATKNIAKDWLSYSYAWRPMIWDVKAAYDIAQEGLEPPLTLRVERNITSSRPFSFPYWEDGSIGGGEWQGQLQDHDISARIGVKTILHTRIKEEYIHPLKQLGLLNPAEIAWELVPFSFVIDWFLPVGTFLSACTSTFGQDFVSGTRTLWLKFDHSYECSEGSGVFNVRVTPGEGRAQIFEYYRTALTSFPTPQFFGKQSFSTRNVVTAAALWRSLR